MDNKTKKVRVSLFPHNYEADTICKFKEDLNDFDINAVISYCENKTDSMNMQEDILYTDDSKAGLVGSNGLVLCDNVQKLGKKAYLNRLKDAADCNKPIYVSSYLYNWLGGGCFRDNEVVMLNNYIEKGEYSSTSLLEIGCPVVSILGMGENCDKFALLLSTRRYLKDKEYKVLAISANPLAKLMGCETFPPYLYESNLSIVEKVIKINHYIYGLVEEQEPDIVLISHASGVMTLSEYEYNYFGEISYILSNAVASDYGIFCTYYNKHYTEEYFKELELLCKIRLGIDILWFYVSNQAYKTDMESKRVEYQFYDKVFCEKNFPADLYGEKRIVISENVEKIANAMDELVNLLSDNPEII